jgi:ligand-binding sensor domain-containing protein/signal transduction histidine kinase
MRRNRAWWSLLAVSTLAAAAASRAERLPVRSYSASQGLPGGPIHRIFRDSKGFIWFCTGEGVARFDGYAFTTLGVEDGLPSSVVLDVLETRDGSYWLATGAGLCRLAPSGANAAEARRPPDVVRLPGDRATPTQLLEDRSGALWCGTSGGLFRVDRDGEVPSVLSVDLGMPSVLWDDPIVTGLAEDGRGGLWVGAGSGLYHRAGDGRVERFTSADGLPETRVRDIALAPDGSLWLATRMGLVRLRLDPTLRPAAVQTISQADGLASNDVLALHTAGEGRLWVGTTSGICAIDGESVSSFGEAQGVHGPVFSIEEDGNGDFWLGGDTGVERLTRNGLVTYDVTDGMADPIVDTILHDLSGNLCVVRAEQSSVFVSMLRGRRFEPIRIPLPPGKSYAGWGWNQSLLQDHLGEWWLPTGQGLWRFGSARSAASLASARPRHVYTTADGLAVDGVFVVFEDSRGDVWFSMASPVTNGLARWRRETDRIESFRDGEGLPPLRTFLPTAFAEDRAGTLWIAFNRGCVARFRDGRFDLLTEANGMPQGWITALLVDRAGRLWIAAGVGGLGVIDDPGATRPKVRHLTVADGLSSNSARCLVEDAWGRIYVGTAAGVDGIEDGRTVVLHFTEAEGLVPGALRTAFRDQGGVIWFGSKRGLSRFTPPAPSPSRSPSILITGVRLAGIRHAVPLAGSASLELPELPFDRNRVQIDFVSPGNREADAVQYEYRLEGAAKEWIHPGRGRSVDFANLAPGRYRFEVRAVTADGAKSAVPASVRFTVLAPVWRRWWFLTLAAAAVVAAAWTAFRYRLHNLLEIERVRTRIAADLHDDIGASLSRIAILSEVVKRQTGEKADTSRFLTDIAETSRQLVDSMGDIVWSIDPRRDDLKHLLARVGQFAGGTLETQGIGWTFEIPDDPARVKLTPEQRRATFLILKEAINNAMKHAACRSLSLRVLVEDGAVTAEVRDDGRGMEADPAGSESSSTRRGRGLLNMRARAREIGGDLTITSRPGAGTTVRLEIPLRPPGAGMNMPWLRPDPPHRIRRDGRTQ